MRNTVPIRRLTSREAVEQAIAEFDRLGRDTFLAHYGYGRARRYFLREYDKHFDSKAIAGVAYGYQFRTVGPLKRSQFSGGEKTVKRVLESLNFRVDVAPRPKSPQR
jgi:hypothetical protein